jgi:uncharacterized protein (TIGR02452 family)
MSARLRDLAREILTVATPDRPDVAAAIAGTRLYRPDDPLPDDPLPDDPLPDDPLPDDPRPVSSAAGRLPTVTVTGESSLGATARLGGDVACLVFASARNPGGGFLNGAQAQEESIARGSALYPCLLAAQPFYDYHRQSSSLLYSDRVIYSPAVPVFRDAHDQLLPSPYPVNFLTCAAPNLSALRAGQPSAADEVPAVLNRRATRILRVAAAHGHRRLVLGAWGCGVFGNDPAVVAGAFAAALRAIPHFDEVVFAVLDRRGGATRTAFDRAFAAAA